jgi:glycosyltransferase involved in cell wall biosynthesis
MRIAFLWDNGTHKIKHNQWDDGLWLALEYIKSWGHEVGYFEPRDTAKVRAFKPDVVLFWGALCEPAASIVQLLPYKKAIAFAGGAIDKDNIGNFDMYFVESEINEQELTSFNKDWMRAFGVNDQIFTPKARKKKWDAMSAAAFAAWKRPQLFAEAVREKGVWVGQHQEHEKWCYEEPKKLGVTIKDIQSREKCAQLMNESWVVLNTSDFWGGGQRLTLEAMACDIPVIAMKDSPKNCEYIEESGVGMIVEPNPEAIKEAIHSIKFDYVPQGREYIESKWTGEHYAKALINGLKKI